MRVVVALDHRFVRTPDGAAWTASSYPYRFWQRYLQIFDRVKVVARAKEVAATETDWQRVDGDAVTFAPVPHYLGPWQYMMRAWEVRAAVHSAVGPGDAVILRVVSQVANCMVRPLQKAGHPFGLEVGGDPHQALGPGCVRSSIRPLVRWWATRRLKSLCASACGVAYVTKSALQKRYPSGRFEIGASDVELSVHSVLLDHRHPKVQNSLTPSLVFVGSLAQMYKGPDVLLDAVAKCHEQGVLVRLVMIGDGVRRPELEARAVRLGIRPSVRFTGELPAGAPVQRHLDDADVFVLPSRTEGLPRAMVEAMARGLPCIGTAVGGIPELLPPEDMVPANNAAALAQKIAEVVGSPGRMTRMSLRNLAEASQYREEILSQRRTAFYRHVYEMTEKWLSEPTMLVGSVARTGECS
jgi:glycosyltransferase involved in cell wall biosynthesis